MLSKTVIIGNKTKHDKRRGEQTDEAGSEGDNNQGNTHLSGPDSRPHPFDRPLDCNNRNTHWQPGYFQRQLWFILRSCRHCYPGVSPIPGVPAPPVIVQTRC